MSGSVPSPSPRPLAISLGDPAGIGPEIIVAAWAARGRESVPAFFVVGGGNVLRDAAKRRGLNCPVELISNPSEAADIFERSLPVLGEQDAVHSPCVPSREGAKLALGSLEQAVKLTISGEASGVVTGPVAKSLLAEVGFTHPGQTEYLAAACGLAAKDAVMMLAGPSLRTVPLTVHCSLAEVPRLITHELIIHRARIMAAALRSDFGVKQPRIAVAGLNPHAGENGKFGREEIETIAPAIAALQTEGINATGPHPADALFSPHARGGYDAALCMYHDQALIPLKALEFDAGVNVTLGLPIVRTSPDHGTAFDIAGKGIANPGAIIAAIRMAGEMAARR